MRIWSQQVEYFSRSYSTLCVDLPGHGKTTWKKISLDEMARDVDEIVRICGISKSIFVASSLGGLIAIAYSRLQSSRMHGLFLCGSLPYFKKSQEFSFGLTSSDFRRLARQVEHSYPEVLPVFFRSLFTPQERENQRVKWILNFHGHDTLACKDAVLHFLKVLETEDLRSAFSSLDFPVWCANGDTDLICQPAFLEYAQKHYSVSRILSFKDCGHFPFVSKPQEFNGYLEEFTAHVDCCI